MKPEESVVLGVFVLMVVAPLYWAERRRAGQTRPEQAAASRQPARAVSFPKGLYPVTTALIAVSVGVSLLSKMGAATANVAALFIAAPNTHGFQSVLAGEVWRLVTPIFLHFGPLHLLFNMLWTWDLGRALEWKKGSGFVLGFVLLVGAGSNLAQYLLTGSPRFGGMSGVVYGFLGYVWMQGRHNPAFGIALNKQTVSMMLGWFVVCWLGLLGPIANWAHTLGLAIGTAWGFLEAKSRTAN